ncbi:hypothetical protein NDA14_004298 [Ustilago hordei]|nr:hypothetical protein NDA14_004298 [Ustilago hordei]
MDTEDSVQVDLGIGPSTSNPTLHASIRFRPITIRFTEPGVPDLRLPLHSITSLRPLHPPPTSTSAADENLIFDVEEAPLSSTQPSKSSITELIAELNERGLMGDEFVRTLKEKMAKSRESVRDRRLRLIHAGRILRDGVKLVGYLDELELQQKIQRRGMLRHLALDKASARTDSDIGENGRRDSEDKDEESEGSAAGPGEEGEEKEGEKDAVEKKEMPVRDLIDWLSSQANPDETDGNDAGLPQEIGGKRKAKGKSREPSYYDDLVRLTIRTAPAVYLQCSVGEVESQPQPSPSSPVAPASVPLIDGFGPDPSLEDPLNPDSLSTDRNRGFNRLLDAGLSPTEISTIRSQFRSTHPLPQSYDLIQSREHSQHLLEMEESWMDNFTSTTTANPTLPEFGEEGGGGGAYMTVFQGLLVGFFVPPLVPLFWFRDKAHPSSIPNSLGEGDEGEGADDEEEWERERGLMMREAVFGGTMQVAVLFGVVAK